MTMVARPDSDPIEWAESADPGDIAVPDGSLQASGFAFLETLPHNVHNWLLREGYRWSVYLDDRLARRVDNLATIKDEVDAGGLFTIDYGSRAIFKPASAASLLNSTDCEGTVNRIRLTGYQALAAHVKVASGGNANTVLTCIDYGGTVLWRYKVGTGDGLTASDFESATAVCFDDTYVYVGLRRTTGAGRIVRLLRSTGVYNSSGGWTDITTLRYCNDIAVDANAVYWATEYSGATESHGYATKASGGSSTTAIDGGVAANAVCVNGLHWFVALDAKVGDEVLAYASNSSTTLWTYNWGTNALFLKAAMNRVYGGGNASPPDYIRSFDYLGAATLHNSGGVPDGIAIDDRWLYVTVSNTLYLHDLTTGRCDYADTSITYAKPVEDADALVVAHKSSTSVMLHVHHGRTRVLRRVTTPSVYHTFPWNEFQP